MNEKQRIRAAVRSARKARSLDEAVASRDRAGITQQLKRTVQRLGASRIACFASTRQEPDTTPFLDWAIAQGIEVLLPRAQANGQLEWALLEAGSLRPGAFGILEPTGPSLPNALHTVDLAFVPAAALARNGARLGWGLGYYDRELAALQQLESRPPVMAVVFESEIYDSLPVEPHDVPVDGAVSELRTHHFG